MRGARKFAKCINVINANRKARYEARIIKANLEPEREEVPEPVEREEVPGRDEVPECEDLFIYL